MLAINNTRICLSMIGCKIFKISDRNTIELPLIMDVIKVDIPILINLSWCQKVEIVEASHRKTTQSSGASAPINTHKRHKVVFVATPQLYLRQT